MDDRARRLPVFGGLPLSPRPELLDVRDAGPAVRLAFRGSLTAAAALGMAFGVALPTTPCRAVSSGERHALWLGPDEWLLVGPNGDSAALAATLAGAVGTLPHSLVDVSHRSATLRLGGSGVMDILNAGCALDLDPAAFPVGMCARTLLGKAEIVLWRLAPLSFHLEASRSYVPYVIAFLRTAEVAYDRA